MSRKYTVHDCKIVELPIVHNDAGNITVMENNSNIPFDVKRIYYLYDIPMGSERGGHSHYELQQYVVAASGSFIFVLDDGTEKKEVFLNHPNKALYIKPGIWREMKDFSSGSICVVLASHEYDEKDYIRDYNVFLNFRKINFVEYDNVFLEKSWHWLNDKEIKTLTNTSDFTKEDQIKFFKSLNNRKDYYIKGVVIDNIKIGVVGLKNITSDSGEFFGYIGEKEYWGKRIGQELLRHIKLVAKSFGLNFIYLNVILDNIRAIKAYERFGFVREENNSKDNLLRMIYKI